MKIKFSLKRPFTPEFNGNRDLPEADQIKCILTTLDNFDLLELGDAFSRAGMNDGELDTSTISAEQARVLLDATVSIIPKYTEMTGLEGDDGPLTVEQIVRFPDFQELATELLVQLAQISAPTEADAKN